MAVGEALLNEVLGTLADGGLRIERELRWIQQEVVARDDFLGDVFVEGPLPVEHLIEDNACMCPQVKPK